MSQPSSRGLRAVAPCQWPGERCSIGRSRVRDPAPTATRPPLDQPPRNGDVPTSRRHAVPRTRTPGGVLRSAFCSVFSPPGSPALPSAPCALPRIEPLVQGRPWPTGHWRNPWECGSHRLFGLPHVCSEVALGNFTRDHTVCPWIAEVICSGTSCRPCTDQRTCAFVRVVSHAGGPKK